MEDLFYEKETVRICFMYCNGSYIAGRMRKQQHRECKSRGDNGNSFCSKSLNSVMDELIAEYNKKNPNVKIVGSYDSSGTLLTQIEEGAACDIFFSAAQKQMDQLADDDGLVVDGTRYNVVNNQVCVVTYKEATQKLQVLQTSEKHPVLHLPMALFRLENIPDRLLSMQECLRAQRMFLSSQPMKFLRHLAVWKSTSAQTLEL